KQRQQQAVQFLNENAFKTPTFFFDDNVTRRIAPAGDVARIHAAQAAILTSVLQTARLLRLAHYEAVGGRAEPVYSAQDLLADLRHGIFSELAAGERIDANRRSLQRAYIENLSLKLAPPSPSAAGGGRGGAAAGQTLDPKMSDMSAIVHAELRE